MTEYYCKHQLLSFILIVFIALLSNCVYAASELHIEDRARLGQMSTDNDNVFFTVYGKEVELYKQTKDGAITRHAALPAPVIRLSPDAKILDHTFHYSAALGRPTSTSYDLDLAILSIKIDQDTQTQTAEVLPKTLTGMLFPLTWKNKMFWLALSEENSKKQVLIMEVGVNGKIMKTAKIDQNFDKLLAAVKLTDDRICIAAYSEETPRQTHLLLLDEHFKVIKKTLVNISVFSLSADSEAIGAITYEEKSEKDGVYQLFIYDQKLNLKNKFDLPLSLHYGHRVQSQLVKGKFFIAGMDGPYESLWVDMHGKIEDRKTWIPKNDADTFPDVVRSIGKLPDGVALIYGKPNKYNTKFDITVQRFAVP